MTQLLTAVVGASVLEVEVPDLFDDEFFAATEEASQGTSDGQASCGSVCSQCGSCTNCPR